MRNIYKLFVYNYKAKANAKLISTMMPIGFTPNCNQKLIDKKKEKYFEFLQRNDIISFVNLLA